MTTNYTVTAVRDVSADLKAEQPIWMIELDRGDGSLLHAVCFPHELFGLRVAQYGIDPEDFDSLLGIALHEQYMDLGPHRPDFVYHVDEKTARDGHLGRLAELRKQYTHNDPDNLFEKIRSAYDPNDPKNEERRALVFSIRMQKAMTTEGPTK
jgi:hypothetical protein